MINIIYEDNAVIVCEKPVGTLSEGEMPALLREQCALGGDPFVVHRLDRGTGGLMVYAKTQKAAAALSAEIQSGDFKKEYLTVIHGVPKESRGTWRDLLYHDVRKNKSYIVSRERRGVREAVLDYEVVKADESSGLSLVLVRLHTGRTHQIRVQFAGRKMPLFGDRRYGAAESGTDIALWSHSITFLHPQNHEKMAFSLPAPDKKPWSEFK